MEFKNFKDTVVRAVSKIGGHTLLFKPSEEREVPEHLKELALANGLVPTADYKKTLAEEAQKEAVRIAQAAADKEAEEARVAQEEADALKAAAEQAKTDAAVKTNAAKAKTATKAK